MKHYNRNGIDILIENSPKTPRFSVNFFFKVAKKQKLYGINSLLTRLLLQGTKTYSGPELAEMFERECIDISTKLKHDTIKISLSFLNEDFDLAMELVKDLLLNSTFDDFDKEVFKIKGEITSDLDNPRMKLTDAFIKNIFKEHQYSETYTKTLEDIDKITKEDVIKAHETLLNSLGAISIVGDFCDKEKILNYFETNFNFLRKMNYEDEIENLANTLNKDEYLWISKNDASQAQILQGCITESFNTNLCAKITVMNNILGASGLSSRLFVNLRDKQGLAYTVRSQYDTMLHSALFTMYIGTAPKNIKKSIEGFKSELEKLANNPPSQEELQGAKENISGRLKYFSQNNSQIASIQGYNYTMGLGLEYRELFINDVCNVTSEDVSFIARKILESPKLTAIIAPDEYKKQVEDLF